MITSRTISEKLGNLRASDAICRHLLAGVRLSVFIRSHAFVVASSMFRFRIRRIRGLSNRDLIIATVLGTVGGYYIWAPVIKENAKINKHKAGPASEAVSTADRLD